VLDAEGRAQQVDLQLAAHLLRVEVDDETGDLDAGVVDDDVKPTQLAGGVGDGGGPVGVVGDAGSGRVSRLVWTLVKTSRRP